MTILGEKEKTGETDSNPGDQVQTVSRPVRWAACESGRVL